MPTVILLLLLAPDMALMVKGNVVSVDRRCLVFAVGGGIGVSQSLSEKRILEKYLSAIAPPPN